MLFFQTLSRQRPLEKIETQGESRSFPPSIVQVDEGTTMETGLDEEEEEETFFQVPGELIVSVPSTSDQNDEVQHVETLETDAIGAEEADGTVIVSTIDRSEELSKIWYSYFSLIIFFIHPVS
jgi:hypothetical protein